MPHVAVKLVQVNIAKDLARQIANRYASRWTSVIAGDNLPAEPKKPRILINFSGDCRQQGVVPNVVEKLRNIRPPDVS